MDPFRVRLLSVSNGITDRELSELKFVCKQHIPVGVLEKIVRPLDLFDELENRNLVSHENTGFLAELLTGIDRLELKDELLGVRVPHRSGDAVPRLIQESLCDHYQNVIGWIQPLTWNDSFQIHIEHIYTNLEMFFQLPQGMKSVQKPLDSYHEMFLSRPGCTKPRRILVEGEAGVGKSTFLYKVAYDWSSSGSSLLPYTIVILVELKQMKGAFKDAVAQQLFPIDFPIPLSQLLSYLSAHQENVLFLLDGFDEADSSCLRHLQDILSGRIFRNSCVVLTSRPGKATHVQRLMDTRLAITGFTTENIRSYVFKYFQDDADTAEELLSELETHPVIEDIAKVPLTAMLICALWEETPDTAFAALTTLTTLFTELVLLMVKRHFTRNSEEGASVDEVFSSLDDIPQDLYNDLLVLGELAFYGLLEDNLLLDVQALQKKCSGKILFELGLLSEGNSTSRLNPVRKCCFIHKSFQEYSAALWLSNEIKSAGNDPAKLQEVSLLTLKCVSKASDSMLLNFVSGLVGEKFELVFVPLLENLKESFVASDSAEMNDFLEMFVLALFESHQGHLAGKLGATLLDGSLKLSGRDISPYGVRAMTYFMQNTPDLKSFVLEHSELEKQMAAFFAKSLSQMPSLRELCFKQNIVGNAVVKAFGENLSSTLPLEKFVFSANTSRNETGGDFASIIKCCPNLRHLDLSYSGLGDEEMKNVIDALKFVPQLNSLNLSGSNLAQGSMLRLSEKLSCTSELACLSLDDNLDIGGEGVLALANGLQKIPKLESLSLLGINRNTERETSKVVYTSLGRALAHCPRLSRLDLSANLLHQGTFVGSCIKEASKLTWLDLSGNAFQDEGAESLAKVLPSLRTLSELFLDRNHITCSGLKSLSESLKLMPGLRKLSLKSNLISDTGVAALAAVAPEISQLHTLFLGYNRVTGAGVSTFCRSMQFLSNLQCLDLKGNLMCDGGISELATHLGALLKLRWLYIGSPVTDSPQGPEAESAKPVAIFSPCKRLSLAGLTPDVLVSCTNGLCEENLHQKCYVSLKEETFKLLMTTAHAHGSLEGIYLSQDGIPKGTDPQLYPRLRLIKQYKCE